MNPIRELPPLNWTEHAAAEICLNGQAVLDASTGVWQIGSVAIAGLIYHSFTDPPFMWMAVSKDIQFKDLLDFRRYAEMIPSGTTTYVNVTSEVAFRFARLYGFRGTGRYVHQNDNTYLIMRRG